MKNLFRILSFVCLASTAHADHYRIYLLGGQSNANGRGDASQLVEPLAPAQTDVRFYWHRTQTATNVGWLLEDQWIDLAPGSGHGTTNPVFPKEFGSELSFGRAMADADPSARIAIIKYSHGGTNLYSQWSATGEMYATFVATVQAGLAALSTAGHTYELRGMIWHQGEADTGAQADNYEANLTSLVNRVRNDLFAGQAAPFVIGSISNSQYGTQITTPGAGPYKVRQAQEAVAANMVQVGFVNTDGFPVRPTDTIHFDHNGQIALGQGFAAQMLSLEANDPDRDGLLNDDEATLGTDPNKADTDGDGQTDGFEVLRAGTDPLSGNSFFAITHFVLAGNEASLTWPSLPGNFYNIESSADLKNWSKLATNYPAASPGTATTWTGTPNSGGGQGGGGVLALYDAETGLNGDFNTTAFDSVDTDSHTTALRLAQGGSLTGGGANLFVLNRESDKVYFDGHSSSGWPAFNCSGVATASQTAAATAGDFLSFTVEPGGLNTTYQSLSFYTNQYGTTAKVDVSYTIGAGSEVFVARNLVPTTSNAPVTLATIEFPDFTAAENVRWTFYLYGAADVSHGVRFDDIRLAGYSAASVIANFNFTGSPPWTTAKENDFATFAARAPSSDSDLNSTTSILSNSGYTGGGYASFYIRDIDGGTPDAADPGDFTIFTTSTTPGVGMNVGNAAATSPTNYIAFTVTPTAGYQTTFESLSFYTGTNAISDTYNIELRAWNGVSETTLGSVSHTSGALTTNDPVVLKSIDFADFNTTSATPIQFRLYGYNVNSSTGGIRYDDIVLLGTTATPSGDNIPNRAFFRIGLAP
jgi:hypothetical protein